MFFRKLFSAVVGCGVSLLGISAQAQLIGPSLDDPLNGASTLIPEEFSTIDQNGVDLTTGEFTFSETLASSPSGAISYSISRYGDSVRDNHTGTLNEKTSGLTTQWIVSFGGTSDIFEVLGVINKNGAKLTQSGSLYTYTGSDGSVAVFDSTLASHFPHKANLGRITSLTLPNGFRYDYHYQQGTHVSGGTTYGSQELISVVTNTGWQFRHPEAGGTPLIINMGYDYCDPATAGDCASLAYDWGGLFDETTYTSTGSGASRVVTLTSPAGRTIKYDYNADDRIDKVTKFGEEWHYSYTPSSGLLIVTVTDPVGTQRRTIFPFSGGVAGRVQSSAIGNASAGWRTTAFEYCTTTTTGCIKGRLKKITKPNGAYTTYTYDQRGNVTKAETTSTSGTITVEAGYAATCTNFKECNKPAWTKDELGNQTDYTYTARGNISTVTSPAPDATSPRPKVIYYYSNRKAWYKNASGNLVAAATNIQLPDIIESCRVGTSCAATSEELRIGLKYQKGTSTKPSNLQLESKSVGIGSDSNPYKETYTYHRTGSVEYVKDSQDTSDSGWVRHRYDLEGRHLGTSGPKPNSGFHQAVKYFYDDDGQITSTHWGIVGTHADSSWENHFNEDKWQENIFDEYGRLTRQNLRESSTTWTVTQVSFDAAGRQECAAFRMNPQFFYSLPDDACEHGGFKEFGRDRIMKREYNAWGEVDKIINGYGTMAARIEEFKFKLNGELEWVEDGNDNRTTFEYDGFGRKTRILYPHKTIAGTSTANDDEWFVYNDASQVIEKTLRDGQQIDNYYDNLGRLTEVEAPGSSNDIDYTYDNFGNPLTITSDGETLSYVWNPLGQVIDQVSALGTITSAYDKRGQRTSVTYPGNFTIDYTYNEIGQMETIYNGSTFLAKYEYDPFTRQRDKISRGNSQTTNYRHNDRGFVYEIQHYFPGSTYDQELRYGYNPAGQIISKKNDNSLYNSTLSSSGQEFTANGLNQLLDGSWHSYDDRGNMTSDGQKTFGYDVFNRLTTVNGGVASGPGGADLDYDPAGRLSSVEGDDGETQFLYDGGRVVAEYDDNGTMTHRYVYGAGLDEVVAMYKGVGGSFGAPSWLLTDLQGSVTAVTSTSGYPVVDSQCGAAINAYDEFGKPNSCNVGRFQYTGQMWIEEAGLYYYKARFYNPEIGRFMQTDPIGYGDGMNMYAYVGNDPMNMVDPTGLAKICVTPTGTKMRSCINVDGDGDGESGDSDLTRQEIAQLRNILYGFISNNNGLDVSGYGKKTKGEDEKTKNVNFARVISQVLGYSISNSKSDTLANAWGNVRSILVLNEAGEGQTNYIATVPFYMGTAKINSDPSNSLWKVIQLKQAAFHDKGNLFQTMIHESLHTNWLYHRNNPEALSHSQLFLDAYCYTVNLGFAEERSSFYEC